MSEAGGVPVKHRTIFPSTKKCTSPPVPFNMSHLQFIFCFPVMKKSWVKRNILCCLEHSRASVMMSGNYQGRDKAGTGGDLGK